MKPNYYLSVLDFSQMFNLARGKRYLESQNKDMRLLKELEKRGVLKEYGDFRELFTQYFKWYETSWHKENGIEPTIGILTKNIQMVVMFKKPEVFKYKEL